MSLLRRLENSYLLSSLPYFPRPPAGYASCQPPWPTPSPPTRCPTSYPQWTAYEHRWNYASCDYKECVNACSPYGEPFYANAYQNLDAPYDEANGFVNRAPESIPQPSVSNYCDYFDATALFPDSQHMFPSTVYQNLYAPDYAANSLGPAPDGALLPASKYSENVPQVAADNNLEILDAAAPLPATAHDMFPIRVIARQAASPKQLFQGCQPPPGSTVQHGITITRLVKAVASIAPAPPPTPRLGIAHLEDNFDTDPPTLQSASTESTISPPTSPTLPLWSTAFASPNMFNPLQPCATQPAAEAAPTPNGAFYSDQALPGFTIVQRTDHSIKLSANRVPTTNRVVKAYRRRRLTGVRKHPRRHGKKKNTPYCRSLPSSPPVVLQYACAPPPTNPWESHGLPPCSSSGLRNKDIGSDGSATSSLPRGTFRASKSEEATSSNP